MSTATIRATSEHTVTVTFPVGDRPHKDPSEGGDIVSATIRALDNYRTATRTYGLSWMFNRETPVGTVRAAAWAPLESAPEWLTALIPEYIPSIPEAFTVA